MNLSFSISRASVSLWWATFWRSICIMLMLLLPMCIGYLILGVVYALLMALFAVHQPILVVVLDIVRQFIPLVLNNIVFPVLSYALAMRWMVRKGQLGSYTLKASYLGESPATFRTALRFAAWTYLEIFKYTWPVFILSGLLGYASASYSISQGALAVIGFMLLPVAIYIHLLTMTDILRRGTYSKNRCTLSFTKTQASV